MRLGIALLMCALPALGAYGNGYTYRRTVTVAAAVVPSTQTSFPMLVAGTYSYLETVANGGLVNNTVSLNAQTVPADLIFTSDLAGATLLNWEVASYTATSGAIEAWVQVPSLSNGTVIYMFYGKAAATTYQGSATSAWDSNFTSVYHMQSANDSSANGYNLSTQGTAPSATASGMIGGAQAFGGAGNFANLSQQFSPTSSFTLAVWGFTANWSESKTLVEEGIDSVNGWNAYLGLDASCSRPWVATVFGTLVEDTVCNPFSASSWHFIAGTYNSSGGLTSLYVDGVLSNSASAANSGRGAPAGTYIGAGQGLFTGTLDEVELSSSVRSANWILTQYNNQSSPSTFYALGAQTTAAATGSGFSIVW